MSKWANLISVIKKLKKKTLKLLQVPISIKNSNTKANETGQQVRVFAAKPGNLSSTRDKKISDLHKYSGMQIPEWVCKYTH